MAKLVTVNNVLCVDYGNDNIKPVIRAWESWNGWFWLATEETEPGLFFGLVQGTFEEIGYFSLRELRANYPRVWEIPKRDLPYSGRRT